MLDQSSNLELVSASNMTGLVKLRIAYDKGCLCIQGDGNGENL